MICSKILVAYDFSDASARALRFAEHLAKKADARLDLVYVMPDVFDGRAELSLELPSGLPGQDERYMHFIKAELERTVSTVLPSTVVPVRCHALRGEPVRRLEALAQELGSDLICVGATGKGAVARVMLGSISQLLVRTSPTPVVTVP
ncbi:MAG: universal stress protein [Myxococcaceae bacterium]|nr:universal stress protein [Myxococcaceae bacterium]